MPQLFDIFSVSNFTFTFTLQAWVRLWTAAVTRAVESQLLNSRLSKSSGWVRECSGSTAGCWSAEWRPAVHPARAAPAS
ncbi:hypothetical protein HaLaN_30099 [Haematococcus lacustris]|uniref:Uncharacterized protein n=1 Tax=Haematococcus lacustris TaxID=44745 RepID=A0A6A0AFS0_HAELA|nr:hypothetical protein HaLaN_30099 [Haematococcus lacustris]